MVVTLRCSSMRQMTGCGDAGSNSNELAPAKPHALRANSMTAHCRPRQIPRNGSPCSLAQPIAATMPSMPRSPKPPGTSRPSYAARNAGASSPSSASLRIQSISTSASFSTPPWINAC